MRLSTAKKLFFLLSCLFFFSLHSYADKKKKTAGKYEKPNIIKRAWGDLTTRNNYYFNASELYKELVHTYEFQRQIDYNKLLPFYYHDQADFSGNTADLETVAKKTGIVLQLHDYSRWRDNAFLLLGKSQFLRQQYDTSLITFQYIVTTMKPGKMNMKLEYSNKDRLKYIRKRQKELAKQMGEKKKFIEIKYKLQQEEAKEKAETAREKQEAAIAKKKKEIEEIIKAKKKIIELQKKGKKIPPELIAKAKGKSTKMDSTVMNANTTVKSAPKPKYDANLPYVLLGDQYVPNPYYKDTTGNRKNQRPMDSLSAKAEAKFDKLTLWEKIKHKPSRPEAIVWMAKSLIELGNFADAKSMISYGKALHKLTKKQRREFYLIDAYYNVRRNDYSPAIEELENAMLYFKKKKEKAYYEYLLAQLYQKNNQPADAVDYFVKAGKHTKTEELNLFSQIQLAKLYSENPDLANQDIVKMLAKLIKMGKNKDHADEVLYTIANYYYYQKDTTNAIAYLQKSVKKSISNNEQKGKSFLRLGEIYYDKEDYEEAAVNYDSAIAYLPNTIENYDQIVSRKSILSELALYARTIQEQDSLQRLGKMSAKDLDKYLADAKAKKEKEDKKNSRFSSDGGDNSFGQTSFVPEDAISNGLWYFYNPEAKSKGFNEFIRIWGERKLEENWRRSSKTDVFNDNNTSANVQTDDTTAAIKSKKKNNIPVTASAATDSLKIPKTPEDFMASDIKIANALFGTGEIFKNKLNNIPKAKQVFDELVRRFPNSDFDAIAHYYEYLIYVEKNLTGLAQKEKDYILQNYPLSEVADVLNNAGKVKTIDTTTETAEKLYASTYQLFLNENYQQVIKNRFIAKTRYPNAPQLPQFEFLEAVSYGKTQQFDAYKKSLTDIIIKYNNGEIKKKAQDYLISYIQFESKLNDSTVQVLTAQNAPKLKDSLTEKFTMDTTDLQVLIQLKDQYIKVSDIVTNVQKFNKKFFNEQKIKINPIFIDGFAILQMKRFEGITDALKYFTTLQANATTVVGENNLQKASFYVIAPSNFKLIKKIADFEVYAPFFMTNYLK
ncbi:MAG TPA: tetratricopeptide repeat protein [Chitinophagales bacterium]|mgnify:CR=1 FL=1|nr:tetratricopeptide repeat protein [Chitinophagales bacterium]